MHNKGNELNEKYEVYDKAQEYAQKATGKAMEIATGIDEKYHVKDKLNVAKEEAQVREQFSFSRSFGRSSPHQKMSVETSLSNRPKVPCGREP